MLYTVVRHKLALARCPEADASGSGRDVGSRPIAGTSFRTILPSASRPTTGHLPFGYGILRKYVGEACASDFDSEVGRHPELPNKIQLLRSVSASLFCGFTRYVSYLLNSFDSSFPV